jgi:hypothetical protein
VAVILISITQLLFFSSFASLQADLIPREKRAKVIGFSQFVSYILMAFGMLAGGIHLLVQPTTSVSLDDCIGHPLSTGHSTAGARTCKKRSGLDSSENNISHYKNEVALMDT